MTSRPTDPLREALKRIARLPHSGVHDSTAVARERARIAREALAATPEPEPLRVDEAAGGKA